jgi:hypothetical protein
MESAVGRGAAFEFQRHPVRGAVRVPLEVADPARTAATAGAAATRLPDIDVLLDG